MTTETLEWHSDAANEQVVLATGLVDVSPWATRARLVRAFPTPDYFLTPEHAAGWDLVLELHRRGLDFDAATAKRLVPNVDVKLLTDLVEARPDVPPNLDYHVGELLWDRAKATALQGPINALLEHLRDPKADRARVVALAEQVRSSLGTGATSYVRDPGELHREVMANLDRRFSGQVLYHFGVPGLDWFDTVENAEEAGIDVDGMPTDDKERSHGIVTSQVPRIMPGAMPKQATVVTAISGSGKALALDTPIATRDGWTTMGEIRPGDRIFDEKGEQCTVLRVTDAMCGRDCYEVAFSDGSTIVADGDHLWLTMSASERRAKAHRTPRFYEAQRRSRGAKERRLGVSESLREFHASRPERVSATGSVRTTVQIAETLYDPSQSRRESLNHSIDVAKPLIVPERDLPIDPYVLGVWLGDGESAGGRVWFARRDRQIAEEMRRRGYVVNARKQKYAWHVPGLMVKLREIGVLGRKRIPIDYLRASIPQRLDLLRGLMDTDGYCSKSGECCFDSMAPLLVEGFGELLASLGIKSRAVKRKAIVNGRVVGDSWRFSFTSTFDVFHLARKSARQVPYTADRTRRRYITSVTRVASVPVKCIEVDSPSRLYLAGRSMIPTHNTTFVGEMVLGLARQGRRVLVASWEVGSLLTMEFLTELSLCREDPTFSRSRMMQGVGDWPAMRDKFDKRMRRISKSVRVMDNPFYLLSQSKGRPSNEHHLDVFGAAIAESGCDVVVADLWSRMLVDKNPAAEESALFRQHAHIEQLNVHLVLVTQQTHKRILESTSKMPTIDGIKGSGGYFEFADAAYGLHRPARWKKVPDTRIEVIGFKQKHWVGNWAVSLDFDPKTGVLGAGRTIPYDPGLSDDEGSVDAFIDGPRNGGGKKGRR